jgi:hypothetical protein
MDLPATPIMQTTSTEKMSIYLDHYSELMSDIVVLYAYHQSFLEHNGKFTVGRLRIQYRKMVKGFRAMHDTCRKAYLEEHENRKIRRKFQADTSNYNRIFRKLNPLKTGRPKKEKQEEQYGIRVSKYYRTKRNKQNKGNKDE